MRLDNRFPDLDGDWLYRLDMTELPDEEDITYPDFDLGVMIDYPAQEHQIDS